MRIPSDAANAFFALADSGKLPGWCVAIAPVDKLVKARNGEPSNPVVWIGEGVVLINPMVNGSVVRFPLGFVEVSGEITTTGGVVQVPQMGEAWLLDGEFILG
ncbi:hypothetical protein [Anabaena sp. CCY 9910]|uniref:hypothetical protein n=1 Tax=Anabaena sp. CCY 9910 TaxID=3103870 RepID=UPI0039E04394